MTVSLLRPFKLTKPLNPLAQAWLRRYTPVNTFHLISILQPVSSLVCPQSTPLSFSPRPQIFHSPRMIIPIRPYSSIPVNEPSPSSELPPNASLKDRLGHFFRQYGKLGVAVYVAISLVTYSSVYMALKAGIDVQALLGKIGIQEREWMKSAGTAAFAYAVYKLLLPARLFLVVTLTRTIARRFGNKLSKGK